VYNLSARDELITARGPHIVRSFGVSHATGIPHNKQAVTRRNPAVEDR
jgi:hypothetical protein